MKFNELRYRRCNTCGTNDIEMQACWNNGRIQAADGTGRAWAVMACPRCASLTALELQSNNLSSGGIGGNVDVTVKRELPEASDTAYKVNHLPTEVSEYLDSSVRVFNAGVPDAAAVQLRRTLEAAAHAKGALDEKKPLIAAIEKLISEGHVTVEFGQALSHVRKLGNQGAHFTDAKMSTEDVDRALRFTVQFLRNLFEVPAELEAITEENKSS